MGAARCFWSEYSKSSPTVVTSGGTARHGQDHDGALDHGIVRPQQGTIPFKRITCGPAVVPYRPGRDRPGAEGPRCFPNLTVRENLLATPQSPGGKDPWTLERVISCSELEERRTTTVTTLRRRAADARHRRALMTKPALLISTRRRRPCAASTAEIYRSIDAEAEGCRSC